MRKQNGIFIFNIIPRYRPGMSDVFDNVKLASLPSSAQRIKQNTFFGSLENICGECLSAIDLLLVFATNGDRDFAKINWVDPGSFTATEVNTLTFTPNIGFNGNGTNSYLNTGWAPNPDAVNFNLNSGSAFCYNNNDVISANVASFGVRGNGGGTLNGQTLLVPDNVSGSHSFAINSNSDSTGTSVSADGFFHVQRSASNAQRLFKNGVQVGTDDTTATNSLSIQNMFIGALNANGSPTFFSTLEIGIFGLGSSLSGQESALYTAWNNYFTSL